MIIFVISDEKSTGYWISYTDGNKYNLQSFTSSTALDLITVYFFRSFEIFSDNTDNVFILQPILHCNGSTNYYDMFM